MKNGLISKNVFINGLRTSLRLEQALWDALEDISEIEGQKVHELISMVDLHRTNGSRTSAVRTFIVTYLRKLASEKGTLRKGTLSSVLSG